MPQLNINISEDQDASLSKVKEACERHGIKLNIFVFNSIIEYFENGKWSIFFKDQGDSKDIETTYTTADIVHDSMQDHLTGDEQWKKI